MAIKEIKPTKGDKIKPFKLEPPTRVEEAPYDLNRQKDSLLNYNEDIRTSRNIIFLANGRLKIPVFSSNPSTCQVGEIAYITSANRLRVCTSTNNWSNV